MTMMSRCEIKRYLLSPIKTDKTTKVKITTTDIQTTYDKYHKNRLQKDWDPDMSDISILFYEKIWGNYFDSNYQKGCGDTMNSFNTIVTKASIEGFEIVRDKESKEVERPSFLKEWYETYHCLANFWVLPKRVGRGAGPNHKNCKIKTCQVNRGVRYNPEHDYVDNHLRKVRGYLCNGELDNFKCEGCAEARDKNNKEFEANGIHGDHGYYYHLFGYGQTGWDNFIDTFCLQPYLSSTENDGFVHLSSMDAEDFCMTVMSLTEKRAELLARKYQKPLSELFLNPNCES